jgi:hypothetical protein
MITPPRPTRQVVPQPTREAGPPTRPPQPAILVTLPAAFAGTVVCAPARPRSTRFEPVPTLEGFRPPVHSRCACLSRSPGRESSGGTDPPRRCQGCFPPSPAPPGSGCPQLHRPAATDRRWVLAPHPDHTRLVAHLVPVERGPGWPPRCRRERPRTGHRRRRTTRRGLRRLAVRPPDVPWAGERAAPSNPATTCGVQRSPAARDS